jgi:hypothetical protein
MRTRPKNLRELNLSTEDRQQLVQNFNERFSRERKIQTFADKINELLENRYSTGIGIGYLYRAVKRRGEQDSISPHASIIVGRRVNPVSAKCEYLVRDSFGADCRSPEGSNRYELPCENGSVWVESRELLKDVMSLTWIP